MMLPINQVNNYGFPHVRLLHHGSNRRSIGKHICPEQCDRGSPLDNGQDKYSYTPPTSSLEESQKYLRLLESFNEETMYAAERVWG